MALPGLWTGRGTFGAGRFVPVVTETGFAVAFAFVFARARRE